MNKYEANETETFGVLVTITSKMGATCVYGQYDLRKIVDAGCKELGYTNLFSDVETIIEVCSEGKGQVVGENKRYILGIVIQPKE